MSRVGYVKHPRKANQPCVCDVCKSTFYAKRSDAKTCSARCRKRLSRGTQSEPMARKIVINSAQGRLFVEVS